MDNRSYIDSMLDQMSDKQKEQYLRDLKLKMEKDMKDLKDLTSPIKKEDDNRSRKDRYAYLAARQVEFHRRAEYKLMEIAQMLSPDHWILQYFADPSKDNRTRFYATCHNGDDNISAEGSTLGAAIARVIGYMLDGGVYPLGGEGGKYIAEQDRKD